MLRPVVVNLSAMTWLLSFSVSRKSYSPILDLSSSTAFCYLCDVITINTAELGLDDFYFSNVFTESVSFSLLAEWDEVTESLFLAQRSEESHDLVIVVSRCARLKVDIAISEHRRSSEHKWASRRNSLLCFPLLSGSSLCRVKLPSAVFLTFCGGGPINRILCVFCFLCVLRF